MDLDIKEYYNKIKNINNEYDNTLELDKIYMNLFLQDNNHIFNKNQDISNLENNNLSYNNEDLFNNNNNHNNIKDVKCIKLYRKLAKILHPDKNINHKDIFIKMSKAYQNNDYITLFMYGYEFYIIINLNSEEINTINKEINNKINLINEIKNKIHWQWAMCENNLERELLKSHIHNNII